MCKECNGFCNNDVDESTGAVSVKCSNLLYGVVEWLNDNPILDGMPYFKTKDDAILYAKEKEKFARKYKMNLRCTIIRLRNAV